MCWKRNLIEVIRKSYTRIRNDNDEIGWKLRWCEQNGIDFHFSLYFVSLSIIPMKKEATRKKKETPKNKNRSKRKKEFCLFAFVCVFTLLRLLFTDISFQLLYSFSCRCHHIFDFIFSIIFKWFFLFRSKSQKDVLFCFISKSFVVTFHKNIDCHFSFRFISFHFLIVIDCCYVS